MCRIDAEFNLENDILTIDFFMTIQKDTNPRPLGHIFLFEWFHVPERSVQQIPKSKIPSKKTKITPNQNKSKKYQEQNSRYAISHYAALCNC